MDTAKNFLPVGSDRDEQILIEGTDIKKCHADYCYTPGFFGKKKIGYRKYYFKYVRLDDWDKILFFAEKTDGRDKKIYALGSRAKEFLRKKWIPDFSPNWGVESLLKEKLRFLYSDYRFQFKLFEFDKLLDEDGEFLFYGPVYAYCFYRENICINIVELVQRQDLWVKITPSCVEDISYIERGKPDLANNIYDLDRYAEALQREAREKGSIYGTDVSLA